MSDHSEAGVRAAPLPRPPSELRAWLLACALAMVGAGVLAAVLSGAIGRTAASVQPPVIVASPTPAPAAFDASQAGALVRGTAASRRRPASSRASTVTRALDASEAQLARRWIEGFYPIYATAQSTFGVNWLLLASIHMQESAFSTAPGTYHGLNFARCCGGPMQFNVTNGPVSTWQLVAGSYLYAPRPATYDHRTATHPSIYDDFDAIMAAAHLLAADGARAALDGSAWIAAYDYYGHDLTGVEYADTVLARAIGWSQHGFCIDCAVSPSLLAAVHAAYGAPVLAALQAQAAAQARAAARAQARARARARLRRRPA
jgi:hypothetical protein